VFTIYAELQMPVGNCNLHISDSAGKLRAIAAKRSGQKN
jgi:hypothetical protein